MPFFGSHAGVAATAVPPTGLTTAARFGGTVSDYLNRTFPAGGNTQLWTSSRWLKQLTVGTARTFLSATDGSNLETDYFGFEFSPVVNQFKAQFRDGTTQFAGSTNADTSNWFNYVIQYNASGGSPQVKVWRDNVLDASGTLAGNTNVNDAISHTIGVRHRGASLDRPFNYICADEIFVDNQALTPSSFGYDNGGTWSWQDFTGTFTGSTDSRLLFANSGNLGENSEGTNWTVNGNVTQETSDLPPQ